MIELAAQSSDFPTAVQITMVINKHFICQGGCGYNIVTERQQNILYKLYKDVSLSQSGAFC